MSLKRQVGTVCFTRSIPARAPYRWQPSRRGRRTPLASSGCPSPTGRNGTWPSVPVYRQACGRRPRSSFREADGHLLALHFDVEITSAHAPILAQKGPAEADAVLRGSRLPLASKACTVWNIFPSRWVVPCSGIGAAPPCRFPPSQPMPWEAQYLRSPALTPRGRASFLICQCNPLPEWAFYAGHTWGFRSWHQRTTTERRPRIASGSRRNRLISS